MTALVRMPKKDWYDILGAKPSDSLMELKRKYQKLVLLYHPDKQSADVPAGEVEERVQRFIEIDQAWKILGNEETKKEYDLQRREDDLTQEWPLDAQIYLEDMSWNNGTNVSLFILEIKQSCIEPLWLLSKSLSPFTFRNVCDKWKSSLTFLYAI
ncbi:dnaJ homolog subfamily C member 24 isoform X1 [Alligator mississippiensis]|uniref:dnaJ homolog subfamily C member 24 isoform X1 n=1 Tax=Alligator mississippiensis TaxID=8496 RepID=UPI002877CBDF|nr:dnaJ homolog subfamily C member 24 isoform X1 [Alligator mississippiensis]XP_059578702.1 dnaJ homolog subfamily C member 24 isoform X1 [Alligator mississippiensis]